MSVNSEVVAEAIAEAKVLMTRHRHMDVWGACDIASSRWELSDEECYELYASMGIKYSG